MKARLQALWDISPLRDGWSEPELVEDTVIADGVTLHRVGISSKGPGGDEVIGSAADVDESPLRRAYFELLERACTIEAIAHAGPPLFPESDAPASFRYARSNGIALHDSFTAACLRAKWELAERDRVLRSWYGEITPSPLTVDVAATPFGATRHYDLHAYSFPAPADSFAEDISVVGFFGFPTSEDAPLFFGYAARPTEAEARIGAMAEAMQLLAFLWGEPMTRVEPALAPNAMFHLETYQVPSRHHLLREWLSGKHRHFHDKGTTPARSEVTFVDLTPQWLGGGMRVAKAICDSAEPLIFGESPRARHLPPQLRVHPIA
jgi:hypothetical protein